MDELNQHLAELGRPFGHRMWHTVTEYIAQYPGDKKHALIDQIEMKILPKLTGLDMADTSTSSIMDKLSIYISGLGDPLLTSAFDFAKQREFFTWQGINRG